MLLLSNMHRQKMQLSTFSQRWAANTDFNTDGTAVSSGMVGPAFDNTLRLKMTNGGFNDTFTDFSNIDGANSTNILHIPEGMKISYAIDPGTGADGNITISSGTKNINTDTMISGRTRPDAPSYNIVNLTPTTATLSTTPTAGDFTVGDEALIIHLQGTASNYANVGNYETIRIKSIESAIITFEVRKTKYYGSGATDDLNIGTGGSQQKVIFQRVPNYNNVTINAGTILTCNAWTGLLGGVLFFRASGALTLYGTLNASGKGFRGGASGAQPGQQGESYGGTGTYSFSANLGGGGGGNTAGDYGGGGGGYGTAGGTAGGTGGTTYGSTNLEKLYLGSGGGGCESSGVGGAGGGVIVAHTASTLVSGTFNCTGSKGGDGAAYIGPGGGGAGGSILVKSLVTTIGTCTINANGGAGGSYGASSAAGGGGRIAFLQQSLDGTVAATPAALSQQTNPVMPSATLKSTNILAGHSVTSLVSFSYSLGAKPANSTAVIQFSQDGTSWYSSAGVLDGTDTLETGTGKSISLTGLGWTTPYLYYKVTLSTSDGLDSPLLSNVAVEYNPLGYASGTHFWTSQVLDSGVNGTTINYLLANWTLDADNIPPKFQLLASNTGAFTGEHDIYPEVGLYYQIGSAYPIINGQWLDVSNQTGRQTYKRYWKVVAYLDTGGDVSDTPNISNIQVTGSLGSTLENPMSAIGDMIFSSDALGTPARLAAGLANMKMFMNAAGAAPSWGTGYKFNSFARDMAAASGAVSYTGVGFKPSSILFIFLVQGTPSGGIAMCGPDRIVRGVGTTISTTVWYAMDNVSGFHSNGGRHDGAVTSYDDDGFTLTWTKTGSPTGTIWIYYLAMR
jgi:hypothetical protein